MTTTTSFGRSTATEAIIEFLNRNGVNTGNQTPADAWRNYLQRQVGSAGTDGKRDLETIWLDQRITTLGGSTANKSHFDLWDTYLNLKNFTGSFDDKFAQWINEGTP